MELVQVSGNLWITEGSGLKRRSARIVAQKEICNRVPGSAQAGWRCATTVGAVLKYEGVIKTGNSDFIVGEKARNEASFLPGVMLSERSSPSRVRFAAPKDRRALDCCGPL